MSRFDIGVVPPIHSPTLGVPQFTQRVFPPARKLAVGDFNADGRKDIVICPSYFASGPLMECRFWLNRGGGRFSDGTSEVYAGPPIRQAGANSVFVADFNGDGRDDVVVIAQGYEGKNVLDPESDRAINHVILSRPDGKLADATATSLPDNPPGFHHPSAIGDLDGDGDLDMAICELGGRDRSGAFLLVNDGAGRFTRVTATLPEELRSLPWQQTPTPGVDYFGCGTVAIADLDGDGVPELVAGNYITASTVTGFRGVRIYRRGAGGVYTRAMQFSYPAGVIAETGSDFFGFGAAHMVVGDLDGDGRPDLVLGLERLGSRGLLVAYRNGGSLAFSDTTSAWLGSTRPWPNHPDFDPGGPPRTLVDLNGDGHLDLVLTQAAAHNQLADWSPFLLNDGTGRMQPWVPLIGGVRFRGTGGLNDQQWVNLLGIPYTNPSSFFTFDATGDGKPDWVFIDTLTNPVEPAVQSNGSFVDAVSFVRVVPGAP